MRYQGAILFVALLHAILSPISSFPITPLDQVYTFAGTGTSATSSDGLVPTSASLKNPFFLALDNTGSLLIGDRGGTGAIVRKVASDTGLITTVTLTSFAFNSPRSVFSEIAGSVLITDSGSHRILRKFPNGTAVIVAGTGTLGYLGDGGLAWNAQLNTPYDACSDSRGNTFIADTNNHVIRIIFPNNTIATFAGNKTAGAGFNSDNIPATSARLNYPRSIVVDPFGDLLITDDVNHRIRKVFWSNRTIITIAGNGNGVFAGDWGPATNASLFYPRQIALSPLGHLFIADFGNNRVRVVFPNGTIATAVGNNTDGYNGEGVPALGAGFSSVSGVAVGPNQTLFISDDLLFRVFRVSLSILQNKTGAPNSPLQTSTPTPTPTASPSPSPSPTSTPTPPTPTPSPSSAIVPIWQSTILPIFPYFHPQATFKLVGYFPPTFSYLCELSSLAGTLRAQGIVIQQRTVLLCGPWSIVSGSYTPRKQWNLSVKFDQQTGRVLNAPNNASFESLSFVYNVEF